MDELPNDRIKTFKQMTPSYTYGNGAIIVFSRYSEVHKDRQCKTEVGICSLAKFSII